MRAFIAFISIAAVLAACTGFAAAEDLTIVYTAGTGGKLRGCECPNDPYGGLSERVTLMRDLRAEYGPVLVVDAGNMVDLFGDYDLKAETVLRMMNMMDYDAAAVGRNEVYRGAWRVRAMEKTAGFPLLSASFADSASGELMFRPYTIATVNGLRVAITAVADSSVYLNNEPADCDFRLLPPGNRFSFLLSRMAEDSDAVVVLSQMHPDANRALLERFPAVDIVIEGYGNKSLDDPVTTGDGIIFAPGSRGQYVGVARLAVENGTVRLLGNKLHEVLDIPEDEDAHELVIRYYRNRK